MHAVLFSPMCATWLAHFTLLELITNYIWWVEIMKFSLRNFLQSPVISSHVDKNIFLSTFFSSRLSLYSSPKRQTKFHTHILLKNWTKLQFCRLYVWCFWDRKLEDRRFWAV
jgi:hypothetical protein